MLLEAIYKYTPAGHPDREVVKKSSHKMRQFAEGINKRKASKAKLLEFSASLKGFEGELIQESRYLVREGHVTNERKRPRYVALMNDLLVICKADVPRVVKKEPVKKPIFKFTNQMKLDASTNLQVRPVAGTNANGQTAYIITLKNSNVSNTIITVPEDGKEWSKDVHSVLEALRKKK